MKAVILVGGEGTRLRPLTNNTPKALVPVLNTPFLEHVIRSLSRHQIKDIILAQGYLSRPIGGYFGDGSQFGVRLYYSIEDAPLGTGGAVKNAEKYLGETFVMLNGDIFTDLDITAMIEFHHEKKAKVTIASIPVDDPTAYGLIETDAEDRITRFLEKPGPNEITTNMINAGTYVLEPDILNYIPSGVKFSIEHELFALFPKREIPARVYNYSTYWMDTGTPEKYLQLHKDLLSGKSRQYDALASGEEVVIGGESYIHPTAQIKGPVLIGNNCSIGQNVKLTGPAVIGPGCTIRDDAVIEESVIWHKVQIGQGVSLKNSIVADNCCLNDNSVIEGSVLGDNVTVASGSKLEPGSKIQPGTKVEA